MTGIESRPVVVPSELETALRDARLMHAFESLDSVQRRDHAAYVRQAKSRKDRQRRAQRCVGMVEAKLDHHASPTVVVRID